jgi:transporter family protein
MLSAGFAAATALLSKVGLREVDPDVAQVIRTAVVLVAVTGLVAVSGRWRDAARLTGVTWVCLTLAGLTTAASWVCYFRALAVGDASRVAAVDKLSVVMIAAAAALLLGERLGALGWLGVALAVVGIMLVSASK